MLVFGTRPEAIKMCPLVKEFQKYPGDFETLVCVTGQHREMLDQVLQIFGVKPDFDLNIMKQGQDLYDVTSRVLLGMREVLDEARPDVVLVHGDTTTSMAAALAAFYRQIPVGHVEAGLRTHNIYSPWPEEMNRQITGRIATYDFAPTPLSRQNLLDEGVDPEKITVTGNTVIDALHWVVENVMEKGYVPKDPSVAALPRGDRRLVLISRASARESPARAHYRPPPGEFRGRLHQHLHRHPGPGHQVSGSGFCVSDASEPECAESGRGSVRQ